MKKIMSLGVMGLYVFSVAAASTAPQPTLNKTKLDTQAALLSIATNGQGQYVAVGKQGVIFMSEDGTQWVQQTNPTGKSAKLNSVTYGNGQYVAVGLGDGVILTSANGHDWVEQANPLNQLGKHWNWLSSVAYGNGQYVAVGAQCLNQQCGSYIISSTTGSHWTLTYQDTLKGALHQVIHNQDNSNPLFVAVGSAAGHQFIITSATGNGWSIVYQGAEYVGNLQRVTYNGNAANPAYVAVGAQCSADDKETCGNAIVTSTAIDATNWSPTYRDTNKSTLFDVIYGGNQYVAVGGGCNGPTAGVCGNIILTSSTATSGSWNLAYSETTSALFKRITYSGGSINPLYVAVGVSEDQSTIFTSSSAHIGTWTARYNAAHQGGLNDVLYKSNPTSGPPYVAVGGLDTILTSMDGIAWSAP